MLKADESDSDGGPSEGEERESPNERKKRAASSEETSYEKKWNEMFDKLKAYKEKYGHCRVPNRYAEDPSLGNWVSTQRRQYRILTTGGNKSVPLTIERARQLMEIGFEWSAKDPTQKSWEERLQELVEFKATYGNTLVPMGWSQNPRLATWVSTQRQEFKLLQQGQNSRLNDAKVKQLNDIGFVWEAQRGRRKLQDSQRLTVSNETKLDTPSSSGASMASLLAGANASMGFAQHPSAARQIPPAAAPSSSLSGLQAASTNSSSHEQLLQLIHQSYGAREAGESNSNAERLQMRIGSLATQNVATGNPQAFPASSSATVGPSTFQEQLLRQVESQVQYSRFATPERGQAFSDQPTVPSSQQQPQQLAQFLQRIRDSLAESNRPSNPPARSSSSDQMLSLVQGRDPPRQAHTSSSSSRSFLEESLSLVQAHAANQASHSSRQGATGEPWGQASRTSSSSSFHELANLLGSRNSPDQNRLRQGPTRTSQDRLNELLLEELCVEAARQQHRQEEQERQLEQERQREHERLRQEQESNSQQASLESVLRELGQRSGLDLSGLLSSTSSGLALQQQRQQELPSLAGSQRNASFSSLHQQRDRSSTSGVDLSALLANTNDNSNTNSSLQSTGFDLRRFADASLESYLRNQAVRSQAQFHQQQEFGQENTSGDESKRASRGDQGPPAAKRPRQE